MYCVATPRQTPPDYGGTADALFMSSMHTQALPPRKALLIAAQDMPVHGLRDGLYLVTPDMAAYDALYTRSVAACRMYGTPMPYATSPTTGGARAKGRTRAV